MRLAKYLAHAGVASRRAAEEIVRAGRVTVGGEIVTDPARDVDDDSARRRSTGAPVRGAEERVGLRRSTSPRASSRPRRTRTAAGRSSTSSTRAARACTRSAASTPTRPGCILLTNDGELANTLTHPRYEVPKTYRVKVVEGPGPRPRACGAARGRRARGRPDRARARPPASAAACSRSRSTRAASARSSGCARRSATACIELERDRASARWGSATWPRRVAAPDRCGTRSPAASPDLTEFLSDPPPDRRRCASALLFAPAAADAAVAVPDRAASSTPTSSRTPATRTRCRSTTPPRTRSTGRPRRSPPLAAPRPSGLPNGGHDSPPARTARAPSWRSARAATA